MQIYISFLRQSSRKGNVFLCLFLCRFAEAGKDMAKLNPGVKNSTAVEK